METMMSNVTIPAAGIASHNPVAPKNDGSSMKVATVKTMPLNTVRLAFVTLFGSWKPLIRKYFYF